MAIPVFFPGATKQGISPGIGALLGIIAAVVFVGVLVLMYKYQRKFMYAFRFQRLQEVPMVKRSSAF